MSSAQPRHLGVNFISESRDGSGLLKHTQAILPKDWNEKDVNYGEISAKKAFTLQEK